jgi:hypothetical protein
MITPTRRSVGASVDAAPPWRAVALVGVTIALLAVVAVASGGFDPDLESGSGGSSVAGSSGGPSEYLLLVAVAGFAGVLVLLAFVFLESAWSSSRDSNAAGRRTQIPRWLAAILLVAVAVLPIAVASWVGGGSAGPVSSVGTRPSAPGIHRPGSGPAAAPPNGWSWAPAIVVAGLAAGAAFLALSLPRRGRGRGTPAMDARRAAAAAALERTIDELRHDPHPGHAVIAAYAWMEDELMSSGWGRRPSDAPFEYLDEAVARLGMPRAPARSLTELFEVARFSHHPVHPSMKDRAIDSLVEIQVSLREEPSR